MKAIVILDCCGYQVKTNTKLYEYIECFKSKKGVFFKKKLKDGREIKKEILLLTVCPVCKHYILKFLWYSKTGGRFQDWDEEKIIRGEKADEIFKRKADDFILCDLPNPFKPKPEGKQSKKIPWVYGKTLKDGISQIPRYMDESEDAGLKVVCPVKVERI